MHGRVSYTCYVAVFCWRELVGNQPADMRVMCTASVGRRESSFVIIPSEYEPVACRREGPSWWQAATGALQGQPGHRQAVPRRRSSNCYSAGQS